MPDIDVAVSPDGRIHMVDDTGAPVTVDRADVQEAIDAGFQPEGADSVARRNVEKEFSDLGSRVATAAEGALQESTFGLGTAGLAGIMGEDYRREALLRRQLNPNSFTAGRIAGGVLPAVFSGGESLLARGTALAGAPTRAAAALGGAAERGAAKLLGEGAIARTLGAGAGAAVEGAASGLGESIAESALENTDWTAERALSSMADGALYGFVGGTGLRGGGEALGAAGKRAVAAMTGGKTFREAVQDIGEHSATRAILGEDAKIWNELTDYGANPDRYRRMGRKLLDSDVPISDLPKAVRSLDEKVSEATGRMRKAAEELDAQGVRVDGKAVLGQIDQQIADLRKVGLGSHDLMARRLEKEVAPLRKRIEAGEELTVSDMWKTREALDSTITGAKRADDPAVFNLRKVRSAIDDGLDDAIGRHGDEQLKRVAVDGVTPEEAAKVGGASQEWRTAREDVEDFTALRNAGTDNLAQRQQNKRGGLETGVLAFIAGGFNPASFLHGVAVSKGQQLIRERGAGWIARAADAIADSESRLNVAAKRLAGAAPRTAGRVAAIAHDKDADSVISHIQRFRREPEYAEAQTVKAIAPVVKENPEVAGKIASRYAADMAYLATKLTPGTSSGNKALQPLKAKQSYPRATKTKIAKLASVLADPTAAIEDLANGKIDLDVIEALKVRRPIVFADLREKVMSECAQEKGDIPFQRRNFLSLAFDFTGDPSLDPKTMSEIQASGGAPPPESKQPAPKGMNPDKYTEAVALPSQKAGI